MRPSQLIAERREDFMRRARVIKRRDQRRITVTVPSKQRACPRFPDSEIPPRATRNARSLVEVRAQVYWCEETLRRLGGEIEIVRRVINGITAEDQQVLTFARIDISASSRSDSRLLTGLASTASV